MLYMVLCRGAFWACQRSEHCKLWCCDTVVKEREKERERGMRGGEGGLH